MERRWVAALAMNAEVLNAGATISATAPGNFSMCCEEFSLVFVQRALAFAGSSGQSAVPKNPRNASQAWHAVDNHAIGRKSSAPKSEQHSFCPKSGASKSFLLQTFGPAIRFRLLHTKAMTHFPSTDFRLHEPIGMAKEQQLNIGVTLGEKMIWTKSYAIA